MPSLQFIPNLILATAFAGTYADGGQKLIVPAYHVKQPPVIDGVIDEKNEWGDIPRFSGLVDANTGQPVVEGGTFWLAYDEKYIYFAARLQDSQPKSIHNTEYRSNVDLSNDDNVALEIDPFGHHDDENIFTMNAAGGTTISIAGGRAAKEEWVGDFLAKGRVTETGWEAEARIPWKIMRLPHKGVHTVLFNVLRNHQRIKRHESWEYVNGGHVENFGRWESPEIPAGVQRTIKLLPYGFGGWDRDNGIVANAGLDVRTPITDTLDFIGSANPDFRNIENGILSIDPSHFARQVAESRPFFLEGSQYFTTSFDEPLFTSQDIRRFDLGFKMAGKLDRITDLGFLDAISYNSENDIAAKVRRQLSAHSWMEIAGTNLDQDGLRNTGTFVQFHHDFGPLGFFAQHETTQDTALGYGHRYNTGIVTNDKGIFTDTEYVEVTPNFLPRLGFAPQVDYHGFSTSIDDTQPRKSGALLDTDFGFNGHIWSSFEGTPYRRGYEAYAATTLRRDSTVFVADYSYDRYQENDDSVTVLEVAKPRSGIPYRYFDFKEFLGKFGGQNFQEESLNAGYRPIKKLQLSGTFNRVHLGGDISDQIIFGGNWDLGNYRSLNGRIVRQGGHTNAYVSLSRSGNKGAEYFLILGDPNATTFRTSLILKVTWPFEVRG